MKTKTVGLSAAASSDEIHPVRRWTAHQSESGAGFNRGGGNGPTPSRRRKQPKCAVSAPNRCRKPVPAGRSSASSDRSSARSIPESCAAFSADFFASRMAQDATRPFSTVRIKSSCRAASPKTTTAPCRTSGWSDAGKRWWLGRPTKRKERQNSPKPLIDPLPALRPLAENDSSVTAWGGRASVSLVSFSSGHRFIASSLSVRPARRRAGTGGTVGATPGGMMAGPFQVGARGTSHHSVRLSAWGAKAGIGSHGCEGRPTVGPSRVVGEEPCGETTHRHRLVAPKRNRFGWK